MTRNKHKEEDHVLSWGKGEGGRCAKASVWGQHDAIEKPKGECGFSTRNGQRTVQNKNGKIGRRAHACAGLVKTFLSIISE